MQIKKSKFGSHYECYLDTSDKIVAKVHTIEDGLAALYVLLGRPREYTLVYDPEAEQVGKRYKELPQEIDE